MDTCISTLGAVIRNSNKSTRLLHPTEVYSSLYYETKIRPRYLAEKGDRTLSKGGRLSLIKDITQKMFSEESDLVKGEVTKKLEEMKEMRANVKEEGDDEKHLADNPTRSPELYQRYVSLHQHAGFSCNILSIAQLMAFCRQWGQSWIAALARPARQ